MISSGHWIIHLTHPTMKSKILTTMLSCAALAALSATASAAVMTYTQTATLSGSLGGTSFTAAAVTFRVTADTGNAQYNLIGGVYPAWTNAGVTTLDIDGFETATFNGSSYFGVVAFDYSAYIPANVVGFADLTNSRFIVYFNQSDELHYNLSTQATFTGAMLNNVLSGTYPGPYSTSLGDLVLSGASGTSTFTAAAVPEPSAFALLGLGAVGLVARRRRVG